jgi:predicted nucleotidyltransferase
VDSRAVQTAIAAYFEQHPGIAAVYLFGSVARGTARPNSDVDVGVLYEQTPPATLLAQPYLAEADLNEQLRCPVQIIAMNQAPVDLVHRILRDGVLVLERNKSLRIAFEVRARNQYFDLLPILQSYRAGTTQ